MVSTSYNDHVRVLNFYKMKIPKSKRQTKKAVERILAKKLCNCVSAIVKSKRPLVPLAKTRKRTKKAKEQAAVAICRNSIFRKKGFMNYAYTCKKKQKLIPGKNGDCLMKYTRKTSIKGGKKKRKYNKKGGVDYDIPDTVFTKLSLIPEKRYEWQKNIRGERISDEERKQIFNGRGIFNLIPELNDKNAVIITKENNTHYNFYFIGACESGIYDKEDDECTPVSLPINGIVSPDNPFRSRKSRYNPKQPIRETKRKYEYGDGDREEIKHHKKNVHNSPTTTVFNFPTP
jgi:hypothetical protein